MSELRPMAKRHNEEVLALLKGTTHGARMAELVPGCRPRGVSVPACPRVVLGKRCSAWHSARRCICQNFSTFLDHGRLWVDKDGETFLTGEPYGIYDTELLARFINTLNMMGLRMQISARSAWYPGSTLYLEIRRTGGTEERSL